MKQLNNFIDRVYLHPVLFAVFPVLALWANNFDRIRAIVVIRPIVTAIAAGLILFILLKTILKDEMKAALFWTLAFLLIFSYGHVYSLILGKVVLGIPISRHRYLALAWLVIFIAGAWFITKQGSKAASLTRFLNRAGLILVFIALAQITYQEIHNIVLTIINKQTAYTRQFPTYQAPAGSSDNLPDVYYIILDGYTRSDVLNNVYGLDNSKFIKQLTDLGFVIPTCTQSNYSWTHLSMTATLNMNYLDVLGFALDPNARTTDYTEFTQYTVHSLVRKNFNDMGYQMISFQNPFPWVEIYDADVLMKVDSSTEVLRSILEPSEFDGLLSQTSLWVIVTDLQNKSPVIKDKLSPAQNILTMLDERIQALFPPVEMQRYDMIIQGLDHLEQVPNLPGKKFVYLHLPAPHHDFVVGPNGEFLHVNSFSPQGYDNQVQFLDRRMIEVVKTILQNSKTPPIIVIQGDHGWGEDFNTRTDILNAYYLPNGGSKLIYPQITPVNTFRVIFNYYFGGSYPLLPDRSFFSANDSRNKFREVPSNCIDSKNTPQN
jgi:hypothetical protein